MEIDLLQKAFGRLTGYAGVGMLHEASDYAGRQKRRSVEEVKGDRLLWHLPLHRQRLRQSESMLGDSIVSKRELDPLLSGAIETPREEEDEEA